MVGRTLQRYRLMEEVGQGGMAVVYRGVDEGLERSVAVKLLHPHLASKPEHRRRLVREAKAVARLKHPNILEIFDFSGEESSDAFLVTELIQGPTLRVFAQEHPFDPPELAAACVYVLAGALAHAHANGIIHRDIKPDNVMIQCSTTPPTVKLMDFGIAQLLDRDERMTITGSLMGSPAHMAPEIIDGEEADERSDIFSMGTILYWLITGVLPFEGPSPGALLKKVLSGEFTDPRSLKPAVSDALAKVIAEALERDRSKRIPTAMDLQKQLGAALADSGIERPEELVARFFQQPKEVAKETQGILVAHLMAQGKAHSEAHRTGRSLAAYSRVMAIVPGTPEAGAARQAIDRLNSRRRWRQRLIVAVSIAATAGITVAIHPWTWVKVAPPAPPPIVIAVAPPPAPPPPVIAVAPPPPAPAPVPPPVAIAQAEPLHPVVHEASQRSPTKPHVVAAAIPDVSVKFVIQPFATIAIDGERVSTNGYFEGELPAGRHALQITNPVCDPIETDFDLTEGKPLDFRRHLTPKPAQIALTIQGPPDTLIIVNNAVRGTYADFKGRPLPVPFPKDSNGVQKYDQNVMLRFTHDGYRDKTVELPLRADDERKAVNVTMEPQG